MGSSCELYLDEDLSLTGQKSHVPDFLRAMFQESDRYEFSDPENGIETVEYRASRESILSRLNLMGCTDAQTQRRFDNWRKEAIQDQRDYMEGYLDDTDTHDRATLEALQALTWEDWNTRVPEVLRTRYNRDGTDRFIDETDERMKDHEDSWLWIDGHESLLSLRAVIAACVDTQRVTLDVGALVGGGWIDADEKICANKISVVSTRGQPAGPTIILAEGRSDIAILKASLGRFHPDLADFVTFLDHSEFKVDGGASYVVKFLKAFAAARVPANVVAVFDNDAAGLSAYRTARGLKLPHNMICVHLPDIDLGRSYPTIGAQGAHDSDINGRACGIELYLGERSLRSNGELRPVRWTGEDKASGVYQGEIEEKDAVQKTFLASMADDDSDVVTTYPEMQLLWRTILDAAATVASASQQLARPPRTW